MYKTLNFPLIFNCQKDDSIKEIFTFDNSNAEIVYYNIISICNVSDKKFYDYYFPATEKSLFNSIGSLQSKQKIKWLRPESIHYDHVNYEYNGDLSIYQNPTESDLKHGFLGNYWLLSGKYCKHLRNLFIISNEGLRPPVPPAVRENIGNEILHLFSDPNLISYCLFGNI